MPAADLERIIRRASDLQFQAGSSEGAPLEQSEVLRIGREVGLEARYLNQAMAEVRADALVPALPREHAWVLRLFGPGLIRASRAVPGDAPEVERKIAEYLREGELLRRVRGRPGHSLWEAAGGLLSTMRRAMDVKGRGYELAKAKSVEVDVESLEAGWSLVMLTCDARNVRRESTIPWYLGFLSLAVPAAVVLSATGGPELPLLLGTGLSGGSALGGATWAARAYYRKRFARIELAVQGMLDGKPATVLAHERCTSASPLYAARQRAIPKLRAALKRNG
ncbi:MAG: hypothetical protein ACE5HQ_09280, partial [Gemmatimonadota bacterium]